MVSDLKTFAHKWCKNAAQKKFFFWGGMGQILHYYQDFFGISATIRIGLEMLFLLHATFSKHPPSGPMLSISRNVRLSVCLFVCPSMCSLLRYRLSVCLPPLPEVGCPIFLDIPNPWGKVMERNGLTFEHFCLKVV